MFVPFDQFSPDVDPATPGIMTDMDGFYPAPSGGIRAIASAVSVGGAALEADAVGAFVGRKLNDSKRIFAGTTTKLFELSVPTWTNVSKAGGYTGGPEARWRFTQFGNVTIATNKADTMQASTSGAFADLSVSAIKASLVDAVGLGEGVFVFAADTNEATNGDQPDRWWTSAISDHTNWVPNVGTQSVTGRLVDTPGGIRGIRKLGVDMILYKERSMYIGRYDGPPVIWSMNLISNAIGCPSQEGIVDVGTAHFFVGFDDFYWFDGTRPQPLSGPMRKFFFEDMDSKFRHKVLGTYNWRDTLVLMWYPSTASNGALDRALLYNIRTGKWAILKGPTIQWALEYYTQGITYDTLGDFFATYNDLPANVAYDSTFWTTDTHQSGIIGSDRILKTISGVPGSSFVVTGDLGDDEIFGFLSRIKPRFIVNPATGQLVHFYKQALGDALTTGDTVSMDGQKRFSTTRAARWHRVRINTTGLTELTGISYTIDQAMGE